MTMNKYFSFCCDFFDQIHDEIHELSDKICMAFYNNRLVLTCGNGGSAADAEHLVAEFIGSCYTKHQAWPAVALTSNTSVITAVSNDFGYENVFSRQVEAFSGLTDVLIGFSTSGQSENVVRAVEVAKEKKIYTFSIVGKNGGILKDISDNYICVPDRSTQIIQEITTMIVHYIVSKVEQVMFKMK